MAHQDIDDIINFLKVCPLAHRIIGQKGSLVFSLVRKGQTKPEGLQTAIHMLRFGEN